MSEEYCPSHVTNELKLQRVIQFGDKDQGQEKSVKRVQEWVSFHRFHTGIDGDFGPATRQCVKQFQQSRGLPSTGVVDQATFSALVAPLTKALQRIEPAPGDTLPDLVLKYAKQHLAQHPVELGGDNRGPWVRVYMDGQQDKWCAGFVTFILKQACKTLNRPLPIPGSFSCDELAQQAKSKQLFVTTSNLQDCCIFLCRRTPTDWTHTGFAFNKYNDTFSTIEGNTNDEGSANGYEVCQRTRSFGKQDFIRLPQ